MLYHDGSLRFLMEGDELSKLARFKELDVTDDLDPVQQGS